MDYIKNFAIVCAVVLSIAVASSIVKELPEGISLLTSPLATKDIWTTKTCTVDSDCTALNLCPEDFPSLSDIKCGLNYYGIGYCVYECEGE